MCRPEVNVHLPKDRISQAHQGFGFCEFLTEEDAEYACKIMNQIKLWGKPIRVNKVSKALLWYLCLRADNFGQSSSDKKQLDVGANLFIGGLDPNVDERLLYDTFSAFGVMSTTAKVGSRSHLARHKLTHLYVRWLEIQRLENLKVMGLLHTQTLSLRMRRSRR
jgi:RNA recognition motif-containing protein